MENNKLIAEFMGMIRHDQDEGCMIQMTHQGNKVVLVSSMKYHTSWDWLMPVVKKCYQVMNGEEKYALHHEKIMDAIIGIDIESTYKAVVEFIKWYNENK